MKKGKSESKNPKRTMRTREKSLNKLDEKYLKKMVDVFGKMSDEDADKLMNSDDYKLVGDKIVKIRKPKKKK